MKRMASSICALALITSATLSAPVCAYNDPSVNTVTKEVSVPVDAHKSDPRARFNLSKEKWNALNEQQKEEIYRLKDITIDVECQIIDKYLEYGIIDKETAIEIKSKKSEYKSEMRKHGKIPGYHEKTDRDKKSR